MANLFQMLSNGVNNLKNNAFNKLLPNNQLPVIQAQQYDDNGNVDYDASLRVQQNTTPLTFAERLMGRNLTMDEQKINPEGQTELVTHSNFKPGLLNDIAAGYQENRNNPISLNNFGQNQNKGIAYRIGEGLGSVGRFVDSPLGRGVLTGAAIGLLGGAPAEILAYGGTATALNQGNRGRDTLYRQQLASEGIDTSNVRGYINDNTYKSMLEAKQMKDNAEYRNTYLAQQKAAQEEAREDRKLERELRREENAANRALTMRGQDLSFKAAQIRGQNSNQPTFNNISSLRKEFSSIPAVKNANEIKRQFDNVDSTYKRYKAGKLRANASDQAMITTLNKILDPTSVVRESEFDRTAQGQAAWAKIEGAAAKLNRGGSGLTDKERDDLYNAMKIMYEANQREASEYIQSYTDLANRYGINPADVMPRQYNNKTTKDNTEIINKLKQNGYSDEKIQQYLQRKGLL